MLNIDSFKCTFMLIMLFVLLAVGEAVVGASREASLYWQMFAVLGSFLGVVLRHGIVALVSGAIVWPCARKTVTSPVICNVIIGSLLAIELIILVVQVNAAIRLSSSFR